MKKFSYWLIFGMSLAVVSSISSADNCLVQGTPIANILTYSDGSVFVYTTKSNNCGCPNSGLISFNLLNDKMGKSWYALAVTAKSLGKPITAFGNTGVCAGNATSIWALNYD